MSLSSYFPSFSFFWSTSQAPVGLSARPMATFKVNEEPFLTYHKQSLAQFQHHLDVLKAHDRKLGSVAMATFFAWSFSNTSYLTTIGFALAGWCARLDYQRQELLTNYRNALSQLKNDLALLKDSGVPWRDLFNDEQVRAMFKALAPFVKKEDLKYWKDSDLKVKGLLGGESDRTDLPRDFMKLLDDIDAKHFEGALDYKLYTAQGYSSIYAFISDHAQELFRGGFSMVKDMILGNNTPQPK